MMLIVHLRIVGCLLLVLVAAHVFFPRWFHWREELPRLSLLNRQMFIVHCLFIALVLMMMAALVLAIPQTLLTPSPLALAVAGGLASFWLLRLGAQLFVYDRRLWRGSLRRSLIHAWFVAMWSYFVAVFGAAFWRQWTA